MRILYLLMILFGTVASAIAGAKSEKDQTITINAVDSAGAPLADVVVCCHAGGDSNAADRWGFFKPSSMTDAKGQCVLDFNPDRAPPRLLYAVDKKRQMAGFQEVSEKNLGKAVQMTLAPACRVFGRLKSTQLEAAGHKVDWTNVYLHREEERPLQFMSQEQEFEFFVPPGHYKLQAYGTELLSRNEEIDVPANQATLDMKELDLPAEKLVTLIGKPAPELSGIKAWYGEPTSLEKLRGKVVLLDFWGYWCGPCVAQMPEVMALHDKYHDQGLEIVSVHTDSVEDAADLQAKLIEIRRQLWHDRALPFRVAIDGAVAGSTDDLEKYGATTAAYGIHSWPTQVLIDRNGNVAGHSSEKLLKQLLEPSSNAAEPKGAGDSVDPAKK